MFYQTVRTQLVWLKHVDLEAFALRLLGSEALSQQEEMLYKFGRLLWYKVTG